MWSELHTHDEIDNWIASRGRVGFVGSSEAYPMFGIWIMELYRRDDGGYSVYVTTDSDESVFVCDFEEV